MPNVITIKRRKEVKISRGARGEGIIRIDGEATDILEKLLQKANGELSVIIEFWDGKTYPTYEVGNGQITIKGEQYPIRLPDGYYIIRKLTVKECMRLQTVPNTYIFPVSN